MSKGTVKKSALFFLDLLVLAFSWWLSYILKFDAIELAPPEMQNSFINMLIIVVVVKLIVLIAFNLYNRLWRYAGITEMIQIVFACGVGALAVTAILFMVSREPSLTLDAPRSIIILAFIFDTIFVGGIRFVYRLFFHVTEKDVLNYKSKRKTLIYGAGSAGVTVLKELYVSGRSQYNPIGFMDDDHSKIGKKMQGLNVYGNRFDLAKVVAKYEVDVVIIAIPTLSEEDRKEIINLAKDTHVEVKILPKVYDIIEGKVSISSIRSVEIEDLLGRDQVKLDNDTISDYISDKKVIVTGGGGSIGSELCRQIARYKPKTLMILDIYENNAYEIQLELRRKYPELDLKVFIASVRDQERINELFQIHQPEVVFHAAAHKHVPLMENNAPEAIKNNVFGTYHVASAANKIGVKKFVLISTDKAVNPTNIMGASKRLCEMIVQSMANSESKTEYVAVRFGNVLGSNGSVIPLFKEQIKNGGPVTVTHPDIIRYFMTIPEAAQLVVQAGGLAKGGEIFVLDMGEPVKIDTLARDLIRLSGFEPDEEIKVQYSGLRPGEKLYEELLMSEEGLEQTSSSKIFVAKPMDITMETLTDYLGQLKTCINEKEDIIAKVKSIVPTYVSNKEVNKEFEDKTNE